VIHALLHIADAIEAVGPVWASWTFPTERWCGQAQRGVKSRRFVYASINKFVLHNAQMLQIRLVHNLDDKQLGIRPRKARATTVFPGCEPEHSS
jgi:hypothetical protein